MATKATPIKARKPAVVVEFAFEKETPGTVRFKEVGTGPDNRGVIGTIYVVKTALPPGENYPQRLTATLQFD